MPALRKQHQEKGKGELNELTNGNDRINDNELKQAIRYFEDAVKETDEIYSDCSSDLKKKLTEQKIHFMIALTALKKQIPIKAKPLKKMPDICKCPICKIDLWINDGELIYCPECGQATSKKGKGEMNKFWKPYTATARTVHTTARVNASEHQ